MIGEVSDEPLALVGDGGELNGCRGTKRWFYSAALLLMKVLGSWNYIYYRVFIQYATKQIS